MLISNSAFSRVRRPDTGVVFNAIPQKRLREVLFRLSDEFFALLLLVSDFSLIANFVLLSTGVHTLVLKSGKSATRT